jgi:hypothetical protein
MVTNIKNMTIRRAMATALVIPAFTISSFAAHNSRFENFNGGRSQNASSNRPAAGMNNNYRQPMQMAMVHKQGGSSNVPATNGKAPVNRPPQNAPVNRPPQNGPVNRPPQNPPTSRPPQSGPVNRPPQNPPTSRPPQSGPVNRPPQNPPTSRPPQNPPVNRPPQSGPVNRPPQNPPSARPPYRTPGDTWGRVSPRGPVNAPPIDRTRLAGGNRGTDFRPRGPEFPRTRVVDIPRERFASSFGRDHHFRIDHPVMVGGRPHFYRDGFRFGIVAAAPPAWVFSDAVYVDSIGGSYFLLNPRYPGVRVPLALTDPDAAPVPAPVSVDAQADDQQSPDSNTVTVGQTISQVVAVLGYPKSVVDMGIRKIYVYDNMRVTFIAGRMTDAR